MKVRILGLEKGEDKEFGSIEWNGDQFHCDPDTPFMRSFLEKPIFVKGKKASSKDDPKAFLEGMQFSHY